MSIWDYKNFRKAPATISFQSFALLPVDMDLSHSGVIAAMEASELASGVKPNILLVSREDHFFTEQLMNPLDPEKKLPLEHFWSRYDFPSGTWCVGNFEAPTYFVGSPGA